MPQYRYNKINKSGLFNKVDGYVLSYQENALKPYKRIYKILLNRYNLIPKETLFIDDNKDNIDTATSLGIIGKKVEPNNYQSILDILKENNLI